MQAAITQLEIALDTLKTNEPINRAAGNVEQADLEAANALEIERGLEVLRRANRSRPTFYVRHPDGSYSAADPQPRVSEVDAMAARLEALYAAAAAAKLEHPPVS